MTLPLLLALAAISTACGSLVGIYFAHRRAARPEHKELVKAKAEVKEARRLLGNALAAEQSAYVCREVGAFDRAQRDEMRAFLGGRDPRDPGQESY